MRILLVEPDAQLAKTYARVLHDDGHEIVAAKTAQSAIHAADAHQPQLVLLEMQLVSHSGIEFLYEFRSYDDWQNIPVIILSIVPPGEFSGNRELLEQALGVVGYYYKPHTTLADLRKLVTKVTIGT